MAAALDFRWDGGRTRLLARTKPDSFNTESLIAFLKELRLFAQGAKVILVWDHLPAHRSKLMKEFLTGQRDWLQIEWLPGYAPDLNPTEAVWNNIKGRELANFCADQLQEATNAFRRGLRRLAHTAKLPFSFLEPFTSLDPRFEGRQHPFRPDLRFRPSPPGSGFSCLFSPFRHGRRFRFRRSVGHVSTFLRSLRSRPITAFLRYYGRSVSCPLFGTFSVHEHRFLLRTGLPDSHARPSDHSVSNHPPCPRHRFRTLPLSATGFLRLPQVWASPQGGRLAAGRPNRVRYPTDWSFTSCCFPPRLTTTQLQSVTGRRAYIWRGLSPLCPSTLSGAPPPAKRVA